MPKVSWDELDRLAGGKPPARYFTKAELACKHCGECLLDPVALQTLDELRHVLGFPLKIVSGYRCPEHNRSVGGAVHSLHMQGKAFDIHAPKEPGRSFIAFKAGRVGFSAIGVYRSFLHVDIGETRTWSG